MELGAFCDIECLAIANVDSFKSMADQRMRKLVHAITGRGILTSYTPDQIAAAALGEGFEVEVLNDRIVMPKQKKAAKALLHFLDNGAVSCRTRRGHFHYQLKKTPRLCSQHVGTSLGLNGLGLVYDEEERSRVVADAGSKRNAKCYWSEECAARRLG